MNKKLPELIKAAILSFFIMFSFLLILRADIGEPKSQETETLEIFSNSEGKPALATGSCNEDSDCFSSGCSNHICSSHSITTTCELGQFPEKETYTCGCQNNRCVWYRYR